MTITTGEDLNRTTSGRFVRNLALSLSGGALLTLLGAGAAHADDLADAGTTSDGAGTAHSGDATAIGNQSGTNSNQTVTVSGNLGTIQVINQNANVSNVGAGVSNSGGNIAIGNGSVNTADGTQSGVNGLGPATNTGTAGNTSNGSAAVSTGNASAIGNQSNTTINQTAHGSAHGQLGGILVINQNANVLNSGVALSNTGGNAAVGNISNNTAGLLQDANTAAGIAANSGKATNNSDGKATISTGNGSATGNKSDTTINQTATGSAGGALGGLVIIDQNANVVNAGVAVANTGGNLAVGNASDNGDQNGGDQGAFLEQNIGDPGDPDIIGVASNNGEASNWSDGSANIRTGDATAIGNDSKTTVNQVGDADIDGPGGAAIISQGSNVLNIGLAAANSGGNLALGNTSDSSAFTDQDAPSGGGIAVGVVGQFGLASNSSDGSANVDSGNAWANGNQSETNVSQKATAEGGAFNLLPQVNSVQNFGASLANSGLNLANGNDSTSDAEVNQEASLPAEALGVGVVGNFGMASNTSDGAASVTTGDATATGNRSKTVISQDIDPTGLVIPVQIANVTNVGFGVANSGLNAAGGNASINNADIEDQTASIGQDNSNDPLIIAGTIVASNNGEASNASDGSASIHTGNATATGNESSTEIGQTSTGHIDGLGFIVNTQTASVLNAGVGLANSGLNFAEGNGSFNDAEIEDQIAEVGSDNDADDITLIGGVITAANNGTASNASDGTASVSTGAASGVGNRSDTKIRQEEGGDISGLGAVINTQVALVGNTGLGIGNSGGNAAIGNFSDNGSSLDQHARVASDNDLGGGDDITVVGTSLIANNSGESSNTSDGTGNISTGSAEGIGNTSSTHIDQATGGDISGAGLVLNTQIAGVANVGLGVANSGLNLAIGNDSDNNPDGPGADLEQEAQVASGNDMNDDINVIGLPPGGSITANNSGEASNTSDGTANVITGAAQGQGNVSATIISQDPDSSIDGAGLVIGTQLAGVANVGVGVANSGLNAAIGNISGDAIGPNEADADQVANIGSDNDDGPVSLVAFGPITASNNGVASNESDGTAKVKTGGALATGNASATNITQAQSGGVSGLGVVIGTQVGGVANVGIGVANSGLNLAVGNASTSEATLTGDGGEQAANVISDNGDPTEAVILGSVTAANDGEASNSSDGEACVCTGAAFASGNVSSTTLVQDLNLSTDGGLVLVTEAGGVLNAGVGLANSGLNLAIGNISTNDSTLIQDATINDALLPIAPSQTAHNGGTASNASDGKGLVASGNAKATGNLSTTNFAQAADVDSALAVSTISGGTTNAGLGLANAGLNLGIGNASTNSATLEQDADGSGIVNNDGTASNESDGEAIIGDPSKCDDVPGAPEAPKPGVPGLPRTGGPIEAEAAIALMLLLVGFGLRRKGQQLA